MIHSTAVLHPRALVDSTVSVGPYAVIDEHVVVGPGCRIGPHVHLTGHTSIGAGNVFHASCVIGDAPQDLKYHDAPTRLRIGERNVFREHVTVHRANKMAEDTVIGSGNFLMVHSHIGHNCVIGNQVILANGALLGGHVSVDDRAFISGNCLVHQFVRIGQLAMMQGGSGISRDLPPYTVARGNNGICGLNIVGLRRAGLDAGERLQLKKLYHLLFRSAHKMAESLVLARERFNSPSAQVMISFVAQARRGVCTDVGHMDSDQETEE